MTDNKSTQWLVVTDLDGTLLNHHDYSTDMALPAIKKLIDLNIPIIFNTSKTFSESITIQEKLNINAPFIVENGSCIYLPKSIFPNTPLDKTAKSRNKYWEVKLGKSQAEISNILKIINTPSSYYQLLSACSIQSAAILTGLNIEQAEQAIYREYSEPLIWKSGKKELIKFKKELKEHNLNTLQGGRFLHVLGNCDKGIATNKLHDFFIADNTQIKTIILGDSDNDFAMLEKANLSIVVNSPSNHQLQQTFTPDIFTHQQAPDGWAEGIELALVKIKELK